MNRLLLVLLAAIAGHVTTDTGMELCPTPPCCVVLREIGRDARDWARFEAREADGGNISGSYQGVKTRFEWCRGTQRLRRKDRPSAAPVADTLLVAPDSRQLVVIVYACRK